MLVWPKGDAANFLPLSSVKVAMANMGRTLLQDGEAMRLMYIDTPKEQGSL